MKVVFGHYRSRIKVRDHVLHCIPGSLDRVPCYIWFLQMFLILLRVSSGEQFCVQLFNSLEFSEVHCRSHKKLCKTWHSPWEAIQIICICFHHYTMTLLSPSVPPNTLLPVTAHRPFPFSHLPSLPFMNSSCLS